MKVSLPTKKQTLRAINRFYLFPKYGLCYFYCHRKQKDDYRPSALLKVLGGRSYGGWYWHNPWVTSGDKQEKKVREQRLMMLAFLLTWANDPDFEV